LLCCCPLNLEKKNPTPQMSSDGRRAASSTSLLGSQITPVFFTARLRRIQDHGSQSMIYRPLLESKIILNTPELVCRFSYTIFINSAVIILHNCLEGLRITGVELPTELY